MTGMKILVFNKVGTLMEVRANVNDDIDLYNVNLEDKAKFLEQLAKSDHNYKTRAVILHSGE
jgi:hypothetical protein